jgi:hypothetical protein
LEALLASAKDEVTKPAGDAIGQLYQALLAMPELKLSDGTTAKVEAFFPPHTDSEGRMHCGIDLRLANGHLLEFTLKNTGWEKSFAKDALGRPPKGHEDRAR